MKDCYSGHWLGTFLVCLKKSFKSPENKLDLRSEEVYDTSEGIEVKEISRMF